MPRIKLQAGPNWTELKDLSVNADNKPFRIESDLLECDLVVRIKRFKGEDGKLIPDAESGYFGKNTNTMSVQLQGRFKQPYTADQLLFGSGLAEPARDEIPRLRTAIALRFIQHLDPGLMYDFQADEPYAMSPLLSTMNTVTVKKHPKSEPLPQWSPAPPQEDVAPLFQGSSVAAPQTIPARRAFFGKGTDRTAITLQPDHVFSCEFAHGFIDFEELSIDLSVIKFGRRLAKFVGKHNIRFMLTSKDLQTTYLAIELDVVDLEGVWNLKQSDL